MKTSGKNRGLGRGLDALFADQEPVSRETHSDGKGPDENAGEDSVIYVSINDIKPNADQPRKVFDEDKIQDLADSITANGIIQPLIVRKSKVGYEIVAGERRWRAARKAGLKEVPCLVRQFTEEENMLVTIIENMQREDLNPIEEAEGLSKMMDKYGMTQEQVSKSVGKSRPYIANSLRLLKLPEEVRKALSAGQISAGHARAILSAGSEKRQKEICAKVIAEGLSVRDTEKLVAKKPKSAPEKHRSVKNRETVSVERELKGILGTKVSIEAKGKGGGTIEISYYSLEELNRLIDMLRTISGDK